MGIRAVARPMAEFRGPITPSLKDERRERNSPWRIADVVLAVIACHEHQEGVRLSEAASHWAPEYRLDMRGKKRARVAREEDSISIVSGET
jgi:hypothetical protein